MKVISLYLIPHYLGKNFKFHSNLEVSHSILCGFLKFYKEIFTTILIIIFWKFLIIQLTFESPQVKRCLIFSIRNLVHGLPKDLRLRKLGKLQKCQMWVQTQPNAQSSLQKLNVDNSFQKTRKIRNYIFEVLPNFIVSLYFVPNILSRIVDEIKIFLHRLL